MSTTSAELSSLASVLTDLTARVTDHAEAARRSGDDESASELYAIERAMTGAARRLERLLSQPRR